MFDLVHQNDWIHISPIFHFLLFFISIYFEKKINRENIYNLQLKKNPNCSSERGRDWMLECLYIGVSHNPLRLNDNDSLANDAMCLAGAMARMPPLFQHVSEKSFCFCVK